MFSSVNTFGKFHAKIKKLEKKVLEQGKAQTK